jgi:hypothetical protein
MGAPRLSPRLATGPPARACGCYTCRYFNGRYSGVHVVCEDRAAVQVIGTPKLACAYWQREPGSNDE